MADRSRLARGSIRWRPARIDDAEVTAQLINANLALAGSPDRVTTATIEEKLANPHWELAADSLVAEADGQVIAAGAVTPPAPKGTVVRADGAVRPDWHRRGVGTELMRHQVDRAAKLRREHGSLGPWTLKIGGFDADEGLAAVARTLGFEPVRYWFGMDRDVDPVPPSSAPDGIEVISYTPDWAERLYQAHNAAFADHWDHHDRGFERFRDRVTAAAAFRPELTMLGVTDEQVADDCARTSSAARHRARAGAVAGYVVTFVEADPGRAIMGLVGTRREWRGKGVASALIAAALAAYRHSGIVTATLGVDAASPTGAAGVYEHNGFRTVSRMTTYSRTIS